MSSDVAPQRMGSVSAALTELSADGWRVLHGLAVPGQRRATVDHVLVGPPGVFVINELEPDARSSDKRLEQVLEAAEAMRGLTSIVRADDVRPVLCTLTESPVDGWRNGVVMASLSTLVELLSGRRAVLNPSEVTTTALELDAMTDRRAPVRKAGGGHRLDLPRRGRRG
jgi:hypothetical protein